METLAYLHVSQNYENPENQELNLDLSQTTGKVAIGLVGAASVVGVLGQADQASARGYYGYYPAYPSYYQAYRPTYYPVYYPVQNKPCYSYYPSYSYYPDYSYYPSGYNEYGDPYYETSYGTYTDAGIVGSNLLQSGDSGPFVETLQITLADLGYYTGPIDGVFGPQTADAVMLYQADRGLIVDGIAGGQTLDSLGLAGYGA